MLLMEEFNVKRTNNSSSSNMPSNNIADENTLSSISMNSTLKTAQRKSEQTTRTHHQHAIRSRIYAKLKSIQKSGDQSVEQNSLKFSGQLPKLILNNTDTNEGKSLFETQTLKGNKVSLIDRPRTGSNRLIQCVHCHRFYGGSSYIIHEAQCSLTHKRRAKLEETHQNWAIKCNKMPTHPPGSICYICGRRYTNSSYEIHIRNCLKQWSIWNSLLPKTKQVSEIPRVPQPTEEEIEKRIQEARAKGYTNYNRLDALDDIMLEESKKNRLPLELIY